MDHVPCLPLAQAATEAASQLCAVSKTGFPAPFHSGDIHHGAIFANMMGAQTGFLS